METAAVRRGNRLLDGFLPLLTLVEAFEGPLMRNQGRFLLLEHLPDGPLLELGMPGRFGVGDDALL